MKSYFPIELIKTADLSPEGKYLMCSHPHGVMCAGLQCAVGSDACGWSEKFKGDLVKLKRIRLFGNAVAQKRDV